MVDTAFQFVIVVETLFFHTGLGAESAIYLPQLANASGTERLVFVDANGKLFKSTITYAQIAALIP